MLAHYPFACGLDARRAFSFCPRPRTLYRRPRYFAEVLASYLGIDPQEVRFNTGLHGKPQLAADTTLRFNLSHSGDLMLIAITHSREIGVDLEFMKDNVPFETLADHYFDPEDAWICASFPPNSALGNSTTSGPAPKHGSKPAAKESHKVHRHRAGSLVARQALPAAGYTAALAVEGGDFELNCWSWLA